MLKTKKKKIIKQQNEEVAALKMLAKTAALTFKELNEVFKKLAVVLKDGNKY